MTDIHLISENVTATEEIGAALASAVSDAYPHTPVFVALYGDLGAGKTAFVRGFASVLSPGSRVKSPTYTIVNEYRMGTYPLFHFDLYRMEAPDALDSIGFEEYLNSGVCIAEWSEHLGDARPVKTLNVTITKLDENRRAITLGLPEAAAQAFTCGERSTQC